MTVSDMAPRREAANSLEFEYFLARELRMTHQQLMQNLGPGELEYWQGYFRQLAWRRREFEQGPR